MKTIEVDDELYQYIAANTQRIGESASDILRRLLALDTVVAKTKAPVAVAAEVKVESKESRKKSTIKDVDQLIVSDDFVALEVTLDRFLLLLSTLYQLHASAFDTATADIRGRTRVYFATSEAELLEAGPSSKPRHIEDTPYWVITNTNTGRKRAMLAQLMGALGYSHQLINQACAALANDNA